MNTVEFPGLWGLKFTINRVAFEVFGKAVYWYGIIIACGFLLAILLAMRNSKKMGLEPDNVIDLVLFATPVAIIAARMFYVVFRWESFRDNPWEILNTRNGGLAIYGGVIGAVIVAFIFSKVKRINVLNLFDLAAPYLIMAQGIGRWGNFMNQEAFGTNTTLPWGMTSESVREYLALNADKLKAMRVTVDPSLPVHPTFLYESVWDLVVFAFLIWFRKRRKLKGEVFFLYMILYGFGRFWIEGLRTDSLMIGNLRISQVLAAVFVVALSILFFVRRKKAKDSEEEVQEGASSYADVLQELKKDEGRQQFIEADTEKVVEENTDTEDINTEEDSD